jgi:hypothetical protein
MVHGYYPGLVSKIDEREGSHVHNHYLSQIEKLKEEMETKKSECSSMIDRVA